MPIFNAYPSKRGIVKPADYSTIRTVIDGVGTWKADNDCWIIIYLSDSTESTTSLLVNGKVLFQTTKYDDVIVDVPGIYINKGDTVEITGTGKYVGGYVKVFDCR